MELVAQSLCELILFLLIGQSHGVWRAFSLLVAQMMLQGSQISYMHDNRRLIIIITKTQDQIVQIHLIIKMFNRDLALNYGTDSRCYNAIS